MEPLFKINEILWVKYENSTKFKYYPMKVVDVKYIDNVSEFVYSLIGARDRDDKNEKYIEKEYFLKSIVVGNIKPY